MRKKLFRIVICLIVCLCVLSSCGSKQFRFDQAIASNMSADDLKAKLGQPENESTNARFKESSLYYTDYEYYGYKGFKLGIKYKEDNINSVLLQCHDFTEKMVDDIIKALNSEYGKSVDAKDQWGIKEGDGTALRWDNTSNGTFVMLLVTPYFMTIQYYLEKDFVK